MNRKRTRHFLCLLVLILVLPHCVTAQQAIFPGTLMVVDAQLFWDMTNQLHQCREEVAACGGKTPTSIANKHPMGELVISYEVGHRPGAKYLRPVVGTEKSAWTTNPPSVGDKETIRKFLREMILSGGVMSTGYRGDKFVLSNEDNRLWSEEYTKLTEELIEKMQRFRKSNYVNAKALEAMQAITAEHFALADAIAQVDSQVASSVAKARGMLDWEWATTNKSYSTYTSSQAPKQK